MLGGSPAQQPTAAAQSDGEGRAATATQQRTAATQGVGNDREGPKKRSGLFATTMQESAPAHVVSIIRA